MAITPNVSVEQANKQAVRANIRGGAQAGFQAIDPAVFVNSFAQASGVLRLSVTDTTSTFTISGTNGLVTGTLSGSVTTGTNVATLVSGLAATALSGYTFFVNAGNAQFLGSTTTDIIVPSGVVLKVVSGTGVTPVITAVTFTGTNAEAVTYPSYVGTPNASPTWIDDATVHAYPVIGQGAIVQDTTKVVQVQVRQIKTGDGPSGGLETQQWSGYLATYSGNLFQTQQKNTKRQQS